MANDFWSRAYAGSSVSVPRMRASLFSTPGYCPSRQREYEYVSPDPEVVRLLRPRAVARVVAEHERAVGCLIERVRTRHVPLVGYDLFDQ